MHVDVWGLVSQYRRVRDWHDVSFGVADSESPWRPLHLALKIQECLDDDGVVECGCMARHDRHIDVILPWCNAVVTQRTESRAAHQPERGLVFTQNRLLCGEQWIMRMMCEVMINMDFKQLKDDYNDWFNNGSSKGMKRIDGGSCQDGEFHVVSVPRKMTLTVETSAFLVNEYGSGDTTFMRFPADGACRKITIDGFDGPWHVQTNGYTMVNHKGVLGWFYDREIPVNHNTCRGVFQKWGGILNNPSDSYIVGDFKPGKTYTIRYEHLNHIIERNGKAHIRYLDRSGRINLD